MFGKPVLVDEAVITGCPVNPRHAKQLAGVLTRERVPANVLARSALSSKQSKISPLRIAKLAYDSEWLLASNICRCN
eukprot:8261329-Pyramimonas_sp.AAC.1